MFRSYDHLQAESSVTTKSGSGFPSNATLVRIFYLVTAMFRSYDHLQAESSVTTKSGSGFPSNATLV
jgi:hypothetical protein